ncbi:MAG: S-layer protein, partial [Cyanobacteriota bacterium]|nr:S-layer protein [Cyanobacteriota bacterium]
MSKLFWNALLAAPVTAGLAFSGAAMAATTVDSLEQASAEAPVQLAQITSVSQLSDVMPSDWAFQALRNLVE